jgi:hypothetical protein
LRRKSGKTCEKNREKGRGKKPIVHVSKLIRAHVGGFLARR